jgi:hypothetical protein
MRKLTRKVMATLTSIAAALVMVVVPAGAAVAGADQISGVANWAAECDGLTSEFTLVIESDLKGCWYSDTIDTGKEMPSGVYIETGTETFVGCMTVDGEEKCGSFSTTYRFSCKFPASGEQICGRCQHPIVAGSGTGDFEGATGRLDFKDNVETGEAAYRGHVALP